MSKTSPRLVVLDGYTLNPGDLSWEKLLSLGNCSIYDRTSPDQVISQAAGAKLVLTNKVVLDRDTIQALPELRYIGVLATGFNVVDLEAASENGITVTNVPVYSTESVAQMVFAHILNFTQQVSNHSEAVHQGEWSGAKDFCFWNSPQEELADKTLGIFGFGRIGRATANLANAFGMRVFATSRSEKPTPDYVEVVDFERLLAESDFLSLHCPLTAETKEVIDKNRLSMMKSSAVLINTSRGALINEPDLASALSTGVIAGAALDVLSSEPPQADHPLIGIKNCVITPHLAWATLSARRRLLEQAVDNVVAFLAGRPQNVVN